MHRDRGRQAGPSARLTLATGSRGRYGLLLGAIITVFFVEGIAAPQAAEQVFVSVLLSATLLLALWTVDARPRLVRAALAISACVILISVVEALNDNADGRATRVAYALLVALAPPAIIVGVVRTLRDKQAVTLEAVFGVLCVYILLGMFFAFVYGSINRFGGAFFAGGQAGSIAHCIYFSFTTLTTVGYGDLTARTNLGHTLAASEALIGQIYLVTVVSLIVANLGRSRPRSGATSS